MISKSAINSQLERIARKDSKLTHHEITVIVYGILAVLDEVDIPSLWIEEVELFLKMLTKRCPHHARRVLAEQCLEYTRRGGETTKKSEESNQSQMTPENF
ncbi:hypothetical protein ACOWPH_00960 [Anabaena sp. PCC 7938]|uniref:hypothetical protein n=1 Tax=Anabaena sp. PCC 7938 TaxID=1296340 RepID=UPI0005A903ED|nr:hypothetical protein [Anabaena sp. CCAP 1446/1C]MBY5284893.1 hypothetical protein [Anabaena sp. CCAP 1446/1C]MCM2409390.1 hypothetical protein [Anabaena sp. CCAP 1446/1C]